MFCNNSISFEGKIENFAKLNLIICLLFILVILHMCNLPIVKTHEQVVGVLAEELNLAQNSTANLTYAGEFSNGRDVLLWFIIQDGSSTYYRAVDCKILPNGYLIKEIYKPRSYARDIVFIIWKTETIFLINNANCEKIVTESKSGNIVSISAILPSDCPYIYHHTPPSEETRTSFMDSNGDEIR